MDFTFTVTVNVEHQEGKFATRDEIRDTLIVEIEASNPCTIEGSTGGKYVINEWDVADA